MSCVKEKNFIGSDDDDDDLPCLADRINNFKRSQNMLPCKEVCDSESDDDAEFLSLIEKISKTPQTANKNGTSNKENISEILESSCRTLKTTQSHMKSQNTGVLAASSDSEDEFLKFSERIRNTPYSQNRNPAGKHPCSLMADIPEKRNLFSGSSFIEKNSESSYGQIKRTPLTQINSNKNGISNKENIVSEVLKPLDTVFKTPQLQIKSRNTVVSAISSDSEDEFLKFSERIRNTPYSQNRNPVGRDPCCLVSDFPEKKKLFSASSLEKRKPESSSHVSSLIKRTPLIKFNHRQNARSAASPIVILSSESDDESEFLKFSERIRNTPRSQNAIDHTDAITSDSEDDVFLKLSEKYRHIRTPKSQSRNPVDENSPLSDFPEKNNSFSTVNRFQGNHSDGESVPDSQKLVQSAYLKEYEILFPSKSETPESFLRNREKYSHQLFDFFNMKIFDSQLPPNLPLIWDNALLRTAGVTACSACYSEPSSFKCTIKLSPGLLTSFDRLQDTLLHEMCHAAVWIISKDIVVKHGPLWQIWAARCTWILPWLKCPERCHNYDGNFRFLYYCPKCTWKRERCRQSQKYANLRCRKCKIPILMKFNDL